MAQQPDGSYPRVNANMIQTNEKFNGMIVSVVGRIQSKNLADSQIQFQCSDGGVVTMDISSAELPEHLDDVAFEAIGQVENGNFMVRSVVSLLMAGLAC